MAPPPPVHPPVPDPPPARAGTAAPASVDGPGIRSGVATPRLRLEPLSGRHAALLFEGLRDPAIYRWISLPVSPDEAHLRARWERVAACAVSGVPVLEVGWAVQRVADGAWIGKMDAEIGADGVATNVGYAFLPPYWRRGYAGEAVAALVAHLRDHGVGELRATVTVGNEASCRVLERAGFVRERVLVGHDRVGGALVDDLLYVRR